MHSDLLPDRLSAARAWLALLVALLLVPAWQAAPMASGAGRPITAAQRLLDARGADPDVLSQPLHWQVLEAVPGSDTSVDTAVAATGAPQVWDTATGADTVVALIDTGVAPIPALEGAVAGEVDFTGSGGGDGHGHGTFMASLIAGRDPRAPGVAPDAGILSLKVADESGHTDLGTVLGALEWLAGPGRALGIEIAVLAAGVSADSPGGEILDLATQRLANLGVLVVSAAGNDGPDALTSPATSPGTISVGALDDRGTSDRGDDVVADFSATGSDRTGVAQPDLHAGGVRVVGSIAADSLIATRYPDAVIDDGLFRGSGTSMATALAGGVAALVADRHPALSGADLAEVVRSGGRLDAVAAVAAADQRHRPEPRMADPAAATSFAEAFTDVATRRAEALADVERDRGAQREAAEQRAATSAGHARSLDRRLAAIDTRAEGAEARVVRAADRELATLERRLRRRLLPMPSTDAWTPARWVEGAWVAGHWATDSWAAHDWTPPTDDLVGWDNLLAAVYAAPAIHWPSSLWNADQWAADAWTAPQWSARTWDADMWASLHWGAVQWGADIWDAVQWGAVQWDAVQWGAVQWGVVAWADMHTRTAGWQAVQWGAVQWGADMWEAVQWGAVQWGAVQWGAVQWGAVQWGAVQWGAVQWGAVQWGAAQWPGVPPDGGG